MLHASAACRIRTQLSFNCVEDTSVKCTGILLVICTLLLFIIKIGMESNHLLFLFTAVTLALSMLASTWLGTLVGKKACKPSVFLRFVLIAMGIRVLVYAVFRFLVSYTGLNPISEEFVYLLVSLVLGFLLGYFLFHRGFPVRRDGLAVTRTARFWIAVIFVLAYDVINGVFTAAFDFYIQNQ